MRELILQRNERLRIEQPQRDLTFGRQVASIPYEDYIAAINADPALRAGDPKAWALFLARPESEKYKVRA